MMKRYLIINIIILLASASLHAVQSSESVGLTQKKLETEQLPDLNIPRYGHCIFFTNGELIVIGGHTTGFVPTATAEYFSGGTWEWFMFTLIARNLFQIPGTGTLLHIGLCFMQKV